MSSPQNKYACQRTTNLSFFAEEIFDHLSGVKNLLSLTENPSTWGNARWASLDNTWGTWGQQSKPSNTQVIITLALSNLPADRWSAREAGASWPWANTSGFDVTCSKPAPDGTMSVVSGNGGYIKQYFQNKTFSRTTNCIFKIIRRWRYRINLHVCGVKFPGLRCLSSYFTIIWAL